jgi:hypothetical protein
MTRPLRYDDSFINIVKEKLHDKFLNLFDVKVQSTAFFQKFSLLHALIIVGLIDIAISLVYVFLFFKIVHKEPSSLVMLQVLLVMIGLFFGIIGINASSTMTKKVCHIFKNWRIFITFAYPLLEIINGFYIYCLFFENCNRLVAFICLFALFIFNLYLTFVSWSFYVRLDKAHELLIIHGKYLDKMMENDSYKIMLSNKYMPPDLQTRGSNLELSIGGSDFNKHMSL